VKNVGQLKKNSFTVVLSSKFATKLVAYFPSNLTRVTTLPCEIQKITIAIILMYLTQ